MKPKSLTLILLSIMFVISSPVFSQSNKVPPFQMTLHDGKIFRAQNLPLDKHIIIVYFSPECEECHEFIKAMLQRMDDLQSASVEMITYMPMEKVKPYVVENKLYMYSNIYVGTEGN